MGSVGEEINRFEALSQYREAWNRLLGETPQAHFFQSWEWFAGYWAYFHGEQRLRVFIHGAEEPIGIVPLVVRPEKTRVGRIQVLTYPLDEWGSYYGPVGADSGSSLQAALEHVRHTACDWDLLELRWVSPEDVAERRTLRAFQGAGFRPIRTLWNHTAVVELSDGQAGWERYLSQRSAKWRANLRTAEKKLAALGPVEYVRYRPQGADQADPPGDFYEACYRIAERSWQARSSTGTTLCHPQVRTFLREVHAAATRLGAVDINLLYVAGRPVAFTYNYVWQGRVYGLRRGFDPQVAHAGAGNVLLAWAIRDSFLRNDRLYDLGVGYLETKRTWMTRILPIYRYSCFPSASARMLLVQWKRQWQAWRQSQDSAIPRQVGGKGG